MYCTGKTKSIQRNSPHARRRTARLNTRRSGSRGKDGNLLFDVEVCQHPTGGGVERAWPGHHHTAGLRHALEHLRHNLGAQPATHHTHIPKAREKRLRLSCIASWGYREGWCLGARGWSEQQVAAAHTLAPRALMALSAPLDDLRQEGHVILATRVDEVDWYAEL